MVIGCQVIYVIKKGSRAGANSSDDYNSTYAHYHERYYKKYECINLNENFVQELVIKRSFFN